MKLLVNKNGEQANMKLTNGDFEISIAFDQPRTFKVGEEEITSKQELSRSDIRVYNNKEGGEDVTNKIIKIVFGGDRSIIYGSLENIIKIDKFLTTSQEFYKNPS